MWRTYSGFGVGRRQGPQALPPVLCVTPPKAAGTLSGSGTVETPNRLAQRHYGEATLSGPRDGAQTFHLMSHKEQGLIFPRTACGFNRTPPDSCFNV